MSARLLVTIAVATLLMMALPVVAQTENDAGSGADAPDTRSISLNLEPGSYTGTASQSDDDWYNVVVTDVPVYVNTSSPDSSLDLDLAIYSDAGTLLDSSASGSNNEAVFYQASGTETIHIQIYPYSTTSGDYSFTIELGPGLGPEDDAGSGADAPPSWDSAVHLTPGSYSADFRGGSDTDAYRVNATNSTVFFNFTWTGGFDLDFFTFNDAGNALDSIYTIYNPAVVRIEVNGTGAAILETDADSDDGTYAFTVELGPLPGPENDAGSGADAPDLWNQALVLPEGSYLGDMRDSTDTDCFRHDTSGPRVVYYNFTWSGSSDIDMFFYDTNDQIYASWYSLSSPANRNMEVTSADGAILCVDGGANDLFYAFTLETGLPENDANSGGDAGDSYLDPVTVVPGSYTGQFRGTSDVDSYRVDTTGPAEVFFNFTWPDSFDIDIAIYDASGTFLDSSYTLYSPFSSMVTLDAAGSAIAQVDGDSDEGPYSFTVGIQPIVPQNDANSGGDAGSSYYSPVTVVPGSYTGEFRGFYDTDSYRVDSAGPAEVFFNFTWTDFFDIDIEVYDETGSSLDWDYSLDSPFSFSVVLGSAGSAIAEVDAGSDEGFYSFTIGLMALPPQNDANSGGDAPDGLYDTPSLDINLGSYTGELRQGSGYYDSDTDVYRVATTQPVVVTVQFDSDEMNLDLELYDSDGWEVGDSRGASDTEVACGDPDGGGEIWIEIYTYSGGGDYEFSVEVGDGGGGQNDAGTGGDAADDFFGVDELGPGSYTATIGGCDDEGDFYKMGVTSGSLIEVEITASEGYFEAILFRMNGSASNLDIEFLDINFLADGGSFTLSNNSNRDGTMFFLIAGSGDYRFVIRGAEELEGDGFWAELSTGAKVGMGIGGFLLVVGIIVAVVLFMKRSSGPGGPQMGGAWQGQMANDPTASLFGDTGPAMGGNQPYGGGQPMGGGQPYDGGGGWNPTPQPGDPWGSGGNNW